ncbi:unnamed protein product [Porites evermanni]|uniref:Uncharacterized protein n=1 Tax=Porites evermanni TaxID=104178 RepID=A0ABN8MLC1_9CNID|nr:unnamed protein product [Porites evermanni]
MHKILKGGKTTNFDGIKLPAEGREISALQQEEGYKYLGVLEASDVLQELKLTKEYFHRIRSILKSRLNRGYVVAAINESTVSHLRCGGGLLEWKKAEVEAIDRKTRKLFTMYGTVNLRANTRRVYCQGRKVDMG